MIINLKKEKYEKHGSKWHLIEAEEEKNISREHYNNITDKRTIQFFRNLGGKEIVERSYTFAGYVPTTIHSISPDRTEKYIYRFSFEK
jgi:hypothetical protein